MLQSAPYDGFAAGTNTCASESITESDVIGLQQLSGSNKGTGNGRYGASLAGIATTLRIEAKLATNLSQKNIEQSTRSRCITWSNDFPSRICFLIIPLVCIAAYNARTSGGTNSCELAIASSSCMSAFTLKEYRRIPCSKSFRIVSPSTSPRAMNCALLYSSRAQNAPTRSYPACTNRASPQPFLMSFKPLFINYSDNGASHLRKRDIWAGKSTCASTAAHASSSASSPTMRPEVRDPHCHPWPTMARASFGRENRYRLLFQQSALVRNGGISVQNDENSGLAPHGVKRHLLHLRARYDEYELLGGVDTITPSLRN